jgi:DeoR family glycerol-3-phosphate regulon repressor
LDFDVREVRVSRAIIDNARKVVLVADHLKAERSAPVRIGHLREVNIFVTDTLASPQLREVCETSQVEVVEVGSFSE